jgi:hypothetical protein
MTNTGTLSIRLSRIKLGPYSSPICLIADVDVVLSDLTVTVFNVHLARDPREERFVVVWPQSRSSGRDDSGPRWRRPRLVPFSGAAGERVAGEVLEVLLTEYRRIATTRKALQQNRALVPEAAVPAPDEDNARIA